ncbi:hypothetical protein MAPG_01063 [Magnaporthiopsis poae ATCC 64411]|uniref:Mid2 domain-containing protein n=1 Tax=Magnaporthiopsis poae (strain ATCC 64411 / 73-15) TaxID=644358 RepID=A0A0C4DMQ2_MAGP6|nr:hypothetical protein MAPG_01063 [Magnaporthiopsis poae ATCC 64411]
MLMLRALRVLLLGLSVFASADPVPGPQNLEDKPCCVESTGRASGLARHVATPSPEQTRQGLDRGQRESPRSWNLWRSGSEPNSGFARGFGLKRGRMYSGMALESPSLLERDVSIVVATATKTATTVTSFITTILSTATHTLTFVDPTLQTQTQTQTVTISSALARRKRPPGTVTTGDEPPATTHSALTATDALPGFLLARHKRQAGETSAVADITAVQTSTTTAAAATTTTTVTTTTTATVQTGGTRTRMITIFATVTVAPNAKTTIFTTTTLFTTPQQGTSTAITTSVAEEPTTVTNPGVTGGTTDGPGTDITSETTAAPRTATSLSSSTSAVTSASIPNPSTTTPSTSPSGAAGPGTSALPSPTLEPSPRGTAIPGSTLSSDQIAGIVLGLIFFIFLLIIISLLLRRRIIQKRQSEAQTGPEGAATAPSSSPTAASDSTPGDANQVRIVIRPPPPPGHDLGPTLFPDDNDNGRRSSSLRAWSITSDFGGTTGAAAAVRHSGVPSSDVMGRYGDDGVEHGNDMTAAGGDGHDAADGRGNGSGNVSGAESGGSGAPRTRLSPPPARSGPSYDVESTGIGRAI